MLGKVGKVLAPGISVTKKKTFFQPCRQTCLLTCRPGFVSLELRESRCFNGRMTQRLECVPPDAMLIVGGRSDTYGVLSSVELVRYQSVASNIHLLVDWCSIYLGRWSVHGI
jgi:hypothetical protein